MSSYHLKQLKANFPNFYFKMFMLYGQQGKEYLDVQVWTTSSKIPEHREKVASHTSITKLFITAKFQM